VSTPEVVPAVPPELQLKPALNRRADMSAQMIVLAVLFAAPALMCVHSGAVADPDIWWHLRTGEWMLQHHALPRVDYFSAPNAGKAWAPYSWLFELLTFQLFQRFGLVGIVGYSASMVLAITVALRHLIKRLQTDMSIIVLLTFTTCFSLTRVLTPRPWLFSILFLVLLLDILMHARKTGKLGELLWLPLIFAAWSNTHIQFIDGLAVLALALAESVVSQYGFGEKTRLRAPWLCAAFAGSVLAAMANPFGWHIYRIAYDLASQAGVMNTISELQSLQFRGFDDFLLLFIALSAAAALGWQKRFRVFETGLLIFATFVSFRSKRDIWVIAVVGATILASAIADRVTPATRLPRWATPLAVLAAALTVFAGYRVMHLDNKLLDAQVVKYFPEHAVAEIQARGYAGPLYNNFDWGGYLIWTLGMPVSIDGRAAFYGDDTINRSAATWNANADWASDPALKSAGLVVGPVSAPLTQVLRTDPHFKIVYEDKLAAVFIAQRAASK